ncbi:MAG: hypothetical protein ACYC67_26515 [Prosthecobacter sp.]
MSSTPALTRNIFSPKAKFYVVDNFYPEVWDEGQLWLIGPNGKYIAGAQVRPMTMDVGTFELTWEQFCGQVEETWAEIYD